MAEPAGLLVDIAASELLVGIQFFVITRVVAQNAGLVALLGYFGWHAFKGPRSFANHERLLAELEQHKLALETVKLEREALEKRVALMRPESLDPDLAGELARETLGYVHVNDIVVSLD